MKLILFVLVVIFALFYLIYIIFGRIFGFHKSSKTTGGGEVTLPMELGYWGIFVCLSFGIILQAWILIIPAFFSWFVATISEKRSNKRNLERLTQLREANMKKYPGIFDTSPPLDIQKFDIEEFDIYDTVLATYLGIITRADLGVLINRFEDIGDEESNTNDIFMFYDSVELAKEAGISCELEELLYDVFEERDCILLRWIPQKKIPEMG